MVLKIFRLYDSGFGLKAITKQLNAENAPSPEYSPPKDGIPAAGCWSWTTVRTLLSREIYHGVIVWNKSRKRNDWGQWNPKRRPKDEWVRKEVEHLRIVPEDLWNRVQALGKETEGCTVRVEGGRLCGRPPKHDVVNLLAGLATCGLCGGGLGAETRDSRTGRRYYECRRRRHTGKCANSFRVRVDEANEAVLSAIEEHVLTPAAVEQVIHLTERDDLQQQRQELAQEAKTNEKLIARLLRAIEAGGEAAAVLARIRALEARQKAIREEIAGLRPVPRLAPTVVADRLGE